MQTCLITLSSRFKWKNYNFEIVFLRLMAICAILSPIFFLKNCSKKDIFKDVGLDILFILISPKLLLGSPQAVDTESERSVHFLLHSGVSWMFEDLFGNTALDCARKRKVNDNIAMIERKERQLTIVKCDNLTAEWPCPCICRLLQPHSREELSIKFKG